MQTVAGLRALALVLSLAAGGAAGADGMVGFEAPAAQSAAQRAAAWAALDARQRARIEGFLLELGVSSTGSVELAPVASGGDGARLLLFRHMDLLGTRLLWSVLVDPQSMHARVLYRLDADAGGAGFVPIRDAGTGP